MDTHSHNLADNTLLTELNELNNLIDKLSKGLCEESQPVRLLERIKQQLYSNTGNKIPNNISTQVIALENQLNSVKSRSKLPKFQLKTKIPVSLNSTSAVNTTQQIKEKRCIIASKEVVIASQSNERFLVPKGQSPMALVTLQDLENCNVEILDAVSSVYVKKLDNCNVIIGPCNGSIMIHETNNSTFKLICKQLRIHDSNDLKCYVNSIIAPIIENCSGIGYGANDLVDEGYQEQLKKAGLEELVGLGRRGITDFCWQKNTPSPNWYYL